MELTLEEIKSAGYKLKPAEKDAWRSYDEGNPIPGYFQFEIMIGQVDK